MSHDDHWLERLDLHALRTLLGKRELEHALLGRLVYVEPPRMTSDERVFATMGDASGEGPAALGKNVMGLSRVTLFLAEREGALRGDCSRCFTPFGPCLHMAQLAVDLAASRPLRVALQTGADAARAFGAMPNHREERRLEAMVDATLESWLGPGDGAAATRLDIAATGHGADETVGVAYGDAAARRTPSLSLAVRVCGEKRLVVARDLARLRLSPRDRNVVRYAEETSGKKTITVRGVFASLTLEAMRQHGGVFGAGFKAPLDFRSPVVRPSLVTTATSVEGDGARSATKLRARWVADGGLSIGFGDALFFPGPYPFIWTRGGALYRVARDVDVDVASRLEGAPELVIPHGRLANVGGQLFRSLRSAGVSLPASDTFGLPHVERPRVILRLSGEPLDFQGELIAIYAHGEVPLFGGAVTRATPPRDEQAEADARALAERVGLVAPADGEDTVDPKTAVVGAAGEQAVQFWQKGLLELRASEEPRVETALSERLARVRLGSAIQSRVHVALEGNWLGTRLEFTANDVPVELADIQRALQRKNRYVPLDDGTLAKITESVEALVEEAREVMGAKSEARLAAHQLGRVERWLEENDGRMDASVEGLRQRLRSLRIAEPDLPQSLTGTLRPYQERGLAWLQFLKALGAGGILADDMGLGKTITTLALLAQWKEAEGHAPSLVVAPTSVASNWLHEIKRFAPSLRAHLLHGPRSSRTAERISGHDIVVTTYGVLRRDVEWLSAIRFRALVLDEAQQVKNADAATRRAAARIDADVRLALSGTPVENRLRELWSIASLVNPGMLGSVKSFERRYERPVATDVTSPRAQELKGLMRPFLLRRTKSDVLPELPPKTEMNRFVTLTKENRRLYDALALTLRDSVRRAFEDKGEAGTLTVFTALLRLRQMACDPRLVDPSKPAAMSAKREAFLELVQELAREGRRALVFSQFVELLTLWRRDLDLAGIRYEYLDGRTRKRDVPIERFQNGDATLFLISLKAGGAGLNLTAADTVIHCDPWWNPAVEDQATDRAYRIGQDKPVTVVRLLAAGTVEEKILSLKAKKRAIVNAVVDDRARALEGLGEDDVLALLGDVERVAASDDETAGRAALPTDTIATDSAVVDPLFEDLVLGARRWLETTGGFESELATLLELPVPFASRLARGEPFPCSRKVADRVHERLALFWRGLPTREQAV